MARVHDYRFVSTSRGQQPGLARFRFIRHMRRERKWTVRCSIAGSLFAQPPQQEPPRSWEAPLHTPLKHPPTLLSTLRLPTPTQPLQECLREPQSPVPWRRPHSTTNPPWASTRSVFPRVLRPVSPGLTSPNPSPTLPRNMQPTLWSSVLVSPVSTPRVQPWRKVPASSWLRHSTPARAAVWTWARSTPRIKRRLVSRRARKNSTKCVSK